MSNNINNILNDLTPEEREAALSILGDIESTGKSNMLMNLYDEDYTEIPVSFNEFVDSPEYAGWFSNNGKDIYPYWKKQMTRIFHSENSYTEVAITGCLSGDTIIPLLNGKHITMKELAESNNLDEYVYSYDLDSNRYVFGHLVDAFSTGVKDVYEIYLDNKTSIKATTNHRFLDKNKQWTSIDSGLKIDDVLLGSDLDIVEYYTVVDIKYVGREEVYDLTVEKYHNFELECGVVAHNSIGTGKSHNSVLALAYCLYRLMCLKDPHAYYGLAKGSYIYIVFFNATLQLSQGVAYTKFQSLLQNSPWFMARGKITGTKNLEYIPDMPIRFTVGSQMEHSIGKDIFCMTGDTEIFTIDGYKKLEDLEGTSIRIYTKYDDGSIKLTDNEINIVKTKSVNEIYEIELEDGTILKCTGNHPLRLKSGEYMNAEDLKECMVLDSEEIAEIWSIKKVINYDKLIDVYDVVNVPDTHNFLVRTNTGYVVSHNCGIMDEVNFVKGADVQMEKSKIMKLYNSVLERINSRFIVRGRCEGKLFLVSSKKSEYDFIESYIARQKGKPGIYVIDAKIWETKPAGTYSGEWFKVAIGGLYKSSKIIKDDEDPDEYMRQGYQIMDIPIEFKGRFELDMQAALMNIAGISITNSTRFIGYDNLAKCYHDGHNNPFTMEVITTGMSDRMTLREFFMPEMIKPEIYARPVFIHIDTSLTGDRTGVSAIAVMGYKSINQYSIESAEVETTKELYYHHIFSVGIQAPSNSEISFQKTRDFIYYLKYELGWNIRGISLDGFQCLPPETMIKTNNGDKAIIDLDENKDQIISYDIENNEYKFSNFTSLRKTGNTSKLIKVKTKSGKEIICTPDHKILTDKGYVKASDLTNSDKIRRFE